MSEGGAVGRQPGVRSAGKRVPASDTGVLAAAGRRRRPPPPFATAALQACSGCAPGSPACGRPPALSP
jgi:hypothetical protein